MIVAAMGSGLTAGKNRSKRFVLAATLSAAAVFVSLPHPSRADCIRPGQGPISTVVVTARARASWYGTGSNGKVTASGVPYSRVAKTAAHRTLPFGTMVEVTNLRNGKKLTVRVTDRGPYVPGREIDVSQAAARKLGFESRGIVTVHMRTKVPVSKGLLLVGISPGNALWIPPKRGALSPAPVILQTPSGHSLDRPVATFLASISL